MQAGKPSLLGEAVNQPQGLSVHGMKVSPASVVVNLAAHEGVDFGDVRKAQRVTQLVGKNFGQTAEVASEETGGAVVGDDVGAQDSEIALASGDSPFTRLHEMALLVASVVEPKSTDRQQATRRAAKTSGHPIARITE